MLESNFSLWWFLVFSHIMLCTQSKGQRTAPHFLFGSMRNLYGPGCIAARNCAQAELSLSIPVDFEPEPSQAPIYVDLNWDKMGLLGTNWVNLGQYGSKLYKMYPN